MTEYILRVRLPNGSFTEVSIRARSPGYAKQLAEAQYGAGSFMGFIKT